MTQKNNAKNPWTAQDEKGHPSRTLEWWSVIGFFTTQENRKQWSIKATLSEGVVNKKQIDSLCNITLFDQEANRHYVSYMRIPGAPLRARQDTFDVGLNDSFIKGSYPAYEAHFRDPDQDIEIDFTIQAESFPYWVAQEATNGWIPMGLGFLRYGFIPKTRISGTIKIHGQLFTLKGTGYFEHVWGNFSYQNPLSSAKASKKTISTYARLIQWWLRNQKPHIPATIMFSTENNPLGYDWAWTVLNNGWTIFYGNILFWMMEGPATGILILSKDGKNYTEFNNIDFRYNTIQTAKNYDFVYPSDFEITAMKEKETLHLRFTMTQECREYASRFPNGRYWLAFVICEAPGITKGYYRDDKQEIALTGICKIEPQRQVSIIGHNSLRIDILKPPKGVGISMEIDSHYLEKKMIAQLRLIPKPILRFRCSKTKKSNQLKQIKPQ
jgi:hypothetical protein